MPMFFVGLRAQKMEREKCETKTEGEMLDGWEEKTIQHVKFLY